MKKIIFFEKGVDRIKKMLHYKHAERMLCEFLTKGVHYEEAKKKIPAKSIRAANSRGCSSPRSLSYF